MLLVDDRALLDAFRQGKRHALERVYRAYVAAVATGLRRGFTFHASGRECRFHGCRTEHDFEDRLHTIFAAAFKERARLSYDGLSPYKTYLLGIAKNAIIDDFRRKEHALVEYSLVPEEAPAQVQETAEPLLGLINASGHPQHDAEATDVVELVARFLVSLPKREREIFGLRYQDGLEHKTICERTGLSPAKVKTS